MASWARSHAFEATATLLLHPPTGGSLPGYCLQAAPGGSTLSPAVTIRHRRGGSRVVHTGDSAGDTVVIDPARTAAVVLVGGQGSRLRPLTPTTPKPTL